MKLVWASSSQAKKPPINRNGNVHKYGAVPSSEHEATLLNRDLAQESCEPLERQFRDYKKGGKRKLKAIVMALTGIFLFLILVVLGQSKYTNLTLCDTVNNGYQCQGDVSHFWGQYSPYFAVKSEIETELPAQCQITFAQVLSRHGARDPTASKTAAYSTLVDRIHSNAAAYGVGYAFIRNYTYILGADQLSVFGQQEMINSGIKFYDRYKALTKTITPFVRSSRQDRVVESAQNWTQGYHQARLAHTGFRDESYPYNIVTISEDTGSNNTLDHGLCTSFEDGPDSDIGNNAQAIWASVFTPNITSRLNDNLPGVNFSSQDTISMMDLCPFDTVGNDAGTISPFCSLFTASEWRAYDYYQTVGKYYSYSWGNPLGPTQGVGFTNELIARLTNTSVIDHTSTNSTLDESAATFPLSATLYADFSHDNDMTGIFSALSLYNSTRPLLNTTIETAQQTKGYSSSWTVPFAARAYFEKMNCVGAEEELVRVIVNDRVLPLDTCGGDNLGRCTLSKFVDSLSFARAGGDWESCFV